MTTGLKRSLVAIFLSGAVAASGFVAPADASPAGGGLYAASVATTSGPSFKVGGSKITFSSTIRSTSSSVTRLHGKVRLKVIRIKTGKIYFSTTLKVDGKSGRSYWSTTDKSKFKKHIWYRVYAIYTATPGHIEKSSTNYKSFKL